MLPDLSPTRVDIDLDAGGAQGQAIITRAPGGPPRVLIVDDVITAGTAVREAHQIITDAGAEVAGLVISLDRPEVGQGSTSAVQDVSRQSESRTRPRTAAPCRRREEHPGSGFLAGAVAR